MCECDSAETADQIYSELDGQEYGETGVRVDLRFIPDEIDFGDDQIRKDALDRDDVADQPPVNYTPPDFVTSALTRSKGSKSIYASCRPANSALSDIL